MNEKRLIVFGVLLLVIFSVSANWFTGDATSPYDYPGTNNYNEEDENKGDEGGITLQRGDVNKDGKLDQADINFLADYVLRARAAPEPLELGDVNGDGGVNVGDLTYLVNHIMNGGPAPVPLTDIEEVEYIRGDLNNDGSVNVGDLTFLSAYLFNDGPSPDPYEVGDVNADGTIDEDDLSYLVAFIFQEGPSPVPLGENATLKCTDTDGGKEFFIKGNTFGISSDGSNWNKSDYCEGNNLHEYSCNDESPGAGALFNCPNGCNEGACTKQISNVTLKRGDVNKDGNVNVGDLTFMVSFLKKNGPAPDPLNLGDVDGDGDVDEGDLTYLVNYIFSQGPPPIPLENQIPATCTDSDGGLDYYLKGEVVSSSGRFLDSCLAAGNNEPVASCEGNCFVSENYCFGNQAGSMKVRCDEGCSDGVCVDEIQTDRCQGVMISRGDVDKDGEIGSSDVNLLVNFIFKSGESPEPLQLGDTNNDGSVNVGDLTYLISYVNDGGPAPKGEGINGPKINPRVRINSLGAVKYCDPFTFQLKDAKSVGTSCANDYECSSNACLDGECVSIKQELERQANLLKKIWCRITNLGSSAGYEECIGNEGDENGDRRKNETNRNLS